MSRTDAHVPYRVIQGEPHRSNRGDMPDYRTLEWLQWWQKPDRVPWHQAEKHFRRYGDWNHRKVESRKVRYSACAQVRDEYAAMLDDQDADLMDCYDY